MIDKQKVKEKFQKSLQTYNQEAFVQKKMAYNLKNMLKNCCGNRFDSIFEIGCGTGLLTEILINSLDFKEYRANDLVPGCIEFVKPFIDEENFFPGDAEKENLIGKNQDLIISNAVFQWFEDMEYVFKTLHNKLNKKGILAFTTFSKDNLKEVKSITGNGLPYITEKEMIKKGAEYFDLIDFKEEEITLFFKSPMKVLKHFKHTGVNSLGTKAMVGKELKNFINEYEKNFGNEGSVSLTYTPMTFLFRRK